MEKIDLRTIQNYKPPFSLPVREASEYSSRWLDLTEKTPEDLRGWPTLAWPGFNEHFGGARGELVVLTGETGTGKSTFALNWLKDSLDFERKSLLVSLENGPDDSFDGLSRMVLEKSSLEATDEEKRAFIQALSRWPLCWLDYEGRLKSDLLFKMIDYVCIERGVKFILLDHLDYVMKDMRLPEMDRVGDCVRGLAERAKRHKCTILLICHPTKSYAKDANAVREIAMDELKGSSSIKQEAASVLVLYRPNPQEDRTWIRFRKIRNRTYSKSVGGRIAFGFNPRTGAYKEITGRLEWGVAK